jgi:hypothetical protein
MSQTTKFAKLLGAIAVAAGSLFSTNTAEAISLRYKFKVDSSGPRMYACNAGIMAQSSNNRVCYFAGTKNSCTPTDCKDSDKVCHSSCVCSSTSGGDYLMNYGKLKWVGQSPETGSGSKTFRGTSTSQYSQAFSDEEAWGRRITDLSFHLGSELYSAKYFVDICYNGPQIEYYEDAIQTQFVLKSAQAYALDALYNGKVPGENSRDGMVMGKGDYTKNANLKVEAYLVCDRQGIGSYVYARNNSGQYNTLDNEAKFVFGANQTPVNAVEGSTSFFASSPMMLTGQTADLLVDKMITNNDGKAPRHCRVRYVFTETNWSSSLPVLRKWEKEGAEMCTYTEIAEPPSSN